MNLRLSILTLGVDVELSPISTSRHGGDGCSQILILCNKYINWLVKQKY